MANSIKALPYHYTLPEWKEGLWLTVRSAWDSKRTLNLIICASGILAGIVAFYLGGSMVAIGILGVVTGSVLGIFALFSRQYVYFMAVKMLKHKDNVLHRSGHCSEFSDDKFIGNSTPGGRSELEWNAIQGWRKGENVTVLIVQQYGGIIIPHRSFSYKEDLAQFFELLTEKLGPPRTP